MVKYPEKKAKVHDKNKPIKRGNDDEQTRSARATIMM